MLARLLTVLSLLLSAGPASAELLNVTFTKVADNSTAEPTGLGTFGSFGVPATDGTNVGFAGYGALFADWGIYRGTGSGVQAIVSRGDAIPDSAFTFNNFQSAVSIHNGDIAFAGGNSTNSHDGIYKVVGGTISTVADTNTVVPGTSSTFNGPILSPSIHSGSVAFSGGAGAPGGGTYTDLGGAGLQVVIDRNTTVPGTSQTFTGFSNPFMNNGNVGFTGFISGQTQGIYTETDGTYGDGVFNTIADLNTTVPGLAETFTGFNGPTMDGNNVAFRGTSASQTGLFTNVGGSLQEIVDTNTAIPDGTGNFTGFILPIISGDVVVFTGLGSGGQVGLYTDFGGMLTRLIAVGDNLDGKTVSFFDFGRHSFSGNQFAFRAVFSDDSQGVYFGTMDAVPEPSALFVLPLVLGVLIWRWRSA